VRAELWSIMREAIAARLCLPETDGELFKQLTTIRYELKGNGETVMQMESKRDMKDRGLSSPDRADALMLTFAHKLQRRDRSKHPSGSGGGSTQVGKTDYDEMAL